MQPRFNCERRQALSYFHKLNTTEGPHFLLCHRTASPLSPLATANKSWCRKLPDCLLLPIQLIHLPVPSRVVLLHKHSRTALCPDNTAALKSGAASCGLCLHSNGAVNRSQQQQQQLAAAAAAAAYSQIYSKTAEFHIRVAHRGFPVSCFTTPFPHFKILIFSVDLEMPLWSLTASTS